ncbi:SRPBCC family protein [Variovorax sp. RTB1]|uniref:SRPBCC family protein n=1 Tax=Variovorax sp. RTB1 TaxID=3048631 RepID=UPI0019AD7796|nr:SRPBCC family protein [Variovorax sp. RTB1]MBC7391791.1 SRPBCC family protein [Variovorax sp.]MEB0110956.1 SRPBCC family protein [Variovorax sp. RTB1]
MEVKLDKRYPLDVDSARAWKILSDVPATAGCMPGAAITDKLDDTHYKGNVKVKVGPASAAFAGDIEVLALDAAAMTLQLLGKGADRGGSSASMNLTATIEPGDTPATSVLVGHAEVIVNGKFAQFGGRLMVQVSDMLLGQFVDNFRVAAAALPMEGVATATEAATEAATEPAQTAAMTAAAPAISPAPTATPFVPAAPAKANEINALAIFWHLVKGWFSGLFGGKRA